MTNRHSFGICSLACLVLIATISARLATAHDDQDTTPIHSKPVRVRLEVTIPKGQDPNRTHEGEVYLAGNLNLLGSWRPDGLKLNRTDNGVYYAEFTLPSETKVQFKVTRGSWQTVEKDNAGRDLPNRQFEVKEPAGGGPQRISITVERWGMATTTKPSVIGTLKLHEHLASKHLARTRNVSVWLPPSYAKSNDRYAVLYLHDGQNLFDASKAAFGVEWQVDETAIRLIDTREISPVIIVGIWNTPHRINEYTLTKDSQLGRGGDGLNYIRFIVEELKPMIDRTYRTRTDREATMIGGSSLGGLISMQACLQHPDVFGACLAFSPSLWWDQERLFETTRTKGWPKQVRLWLSTGTREGPNAEAQLLHLARARRFRDLLGSPGHKSEVRLDFREFVDGTHDEKSWATQLPIALKTLLGSKAR